MCVDVYNSFRGCNHRIYQNTFNCHVARRCAPTSDMLLDRTKFLPDKPPKIPAGLLQCKRSVAVRPKDTQCPVCAREERRTPATASKTAGRMGRESSTPPGKRARRLQTIPEESLRNGNWLLMYQTEERLDSPSPDPRAVERVRNSLMLLEQQRHSP